MLRYLILSLFLFGCSSSDILPGSNSSTPQRPEPAFCSFSGTITSSITISGSANYVKRTPTASGLTAVSGNLPIRFAEVAVLSAAGNVLQCGTTDDSGNFSLSIQSTSSNVYVQVRSRIKSSSAISNAYRPKSGNLSMEVSVLDNHTNVNYHSINSSSFAGSSNRSGLSLSAPHNGELQGGAFHILDQILKANEFLYDKTLACTSPCVPFTGISKASVFWEKGFDPGSYIGASPVSYYIQGTSRLYILGGSNGDVNTTDTDHFDESIILHEYGHFIEDILSQSDSPGGSHDANSLIDPRLAFSEGWATYLSLSVQNSAIYIDTYGNPDGSTGVYFYHNLDTNSPRRDPSSAAYSFTQGEGIFREFLIVRTLLDATDDNSADDSDADALAIPFSQFWAVFSGSDATNSFALSSVKYRNASLFFEFHDALYNEAAFITHIEANQMYESTTAPYRFHYGHPLTTAGACRLIQASHDKSASAGASTEDGSFSGSNPFASNDFYVIDHAGGALSVALTQVSNPQDLDIYLYTEDYTFGASTDVISFSDNDGTANESLSISSLAAGKYMLNVKVFTGGSTWLSTNTRYKLELNGNTIACP